MKAFGASGIKTKNTQLLTTAKFGGEQEADETSEPVFERKKKSFMENRLQLKQAANQQQSSVANPSLAVNNFYDHKAEQFHSGGDHSPNRYQRRLKKADNSDIK